MFDGYFFALSMNKEGIEACSATQELKSILTTEFKFCSLSSSSSDNRCKESNRREGGCAERKMRCINIWNLAAKAETLSQENMRGEKRNKIGKDIEFGWYSGLHSSSAGANMGT